MVPELGTLTISSDMGNLGHVREFIEGTCRKAGIESVTTNAIVLAANEAVSNIIRHAHRDRGEAAIQIVCELRGDGIEISFLDEGPPFDLDQVPRLDPAEIRPGGRGVFLIRALMDEVFCERRRERGNTLRMVKRCRTNLMETSGE